MNKTSGYRFTIIVPVFNEEDNIVRLEETLASFLPKCVCKTCVLFRRRWIKGQEPGGYQGHLLEA